MPGYLLPLPEPVFVVLIDAEREICDSVAIRGLADHCIPAQPPEQGDFVVLLFVFPVSLRGTSRKGAWRLRLTRREAENAIILTGTPDLLPESKRLSSREARGSRD